ncbi:MAG: MarR family transcriptional regulator [Cyclobacteriaceae bacterium]
MEHLFQGSNYGFHIEVTMKKIRQTLQKKLVENGLDITVDQWVILDHLVQTDGISQQELGDLTFKDAPTITRIIDLLVKKNLVARETSKTDRRKFSILLTHVGREVYGQVLPEVEALRSAGWEHLSEKDFNELMRILRTVFVNMQTYQNDNPGD